MNSALRTTLDSYYIWRIGDFPVLGLLPGGDNHGVTSAILQVSPLGDVPGHLHVLILHLLQKQAWLP